MHSSATTLHWELTTANGAHALRLTKTHPCTHCAPDLNRSRASRSTCSSLGALPYLKLEAGAPVVGGIAAEGHRISQASIHRLHRW
eukprot:1137380-Pelagomonas_calceolata.AAC.5